MTFYLTERSCLLVREIDGQNGDLHYNGKGKVITSDFFSIITIRREREYVAFKRVFK
jgi:hypothetical protein